MQKDIDALREAIEDMASPPNSHIPSRKTLGQMRKNLNRIEYNWIAISKATDDTAARMKLFKKVAERALKARERPPVLRKWPACLANHRRARGSYGIDYNGLATGQESPGTH
jgi:hypothetical protein